MADAALGQSTWKGRRRGRGGELVAWLDNGDGVRSWRHLDAGFYESPWGGKFPRIQLLTVLRDGDRYSLVTRATLRGFDSSRGSFAGGSEVLTQSIHESGHGHVKVLGDRQRINHPKGEPVSRFRRIRLVWGMSLNATLLMDWTYTPQPDRPHRRITLTVALDELPPSSGVDIWLAERTLDAELHAEWERGYEQIVASVTARWTQPEVAAVITAVTIPAR